MSEELLYNQLYKRTKLFSRAQFIKELIKSERENRQLKEQLQQKDEVIEEAIKKCEQEIRASTYQYDKSHKQQDWVYKVAHERVLDILNKYKKEESE